jgi:hypothetical protein
MRAGFPSSVAVMEIDERRLAERRQLIDHCDYFFRPPASFYAELEHAIKLAAAGRERASMSFRGDTVPVAELIEDYDLEEFVERVKNSGSVRDQYLVAEAPLPGFEPGFPD